MGGMRPWVAATGALLLIASQAYAEDAHVNANGNPFSGGLNFDPADVSVKVGESVHWTNTDSAVPHNSIEDHGLWEVSGDYGIPGSMGYGPGESVARTFEAGTHHYYCSVHPEDMRAVVNVPVTLKRKRGKAVATWATRGPEEGLAFDVRRKKGKGGWKTFLTATTETKATFKLGRSRWQVQARLRDAKDQKKATDWSPAAEIAP